MKSKKKVVLMGYGKGLCLIADVVNKYFDLVGVFTQDEEFYNSNDVYFSRLAKYALYEDAIEYCKKEKIDCFRDSSVMTAKSLEWFHSKSPDLIICYSLWEIVGKEFLESFSDVFNVHGSNIPYLRGRAPQSWAILNGFNKIGLSIHRMINEVDKGQVVNNCEIPVEIDDIPLAIMKRQERKLPELVKDFCEDYISGSLNQINIDFDLGNYWPRLNTEEHGEVTWDMDGFLIERMVRAFNNPFPGAWVRYNGNKLRLMEVRVINEPEFVSCFSGIVFNKTKEEVFVTTGDGYIAIRTVEYEGMVLSAPEFLKLGRI